MGNRLYESTANRASALTDPSSRPHFPRVAGALGRVVPPQLTKVPAAHGVSRRYLSSTAPIFEVSMGIPGLIVLAMLMLLRYLPLAEAGLTLTSSPTSSA